MEQTFENDVKLAYEAFDKEYEANEVQPYNAAFDYYYAGAKMYKEKYDDLYNNFLRLNADIDNMRKNFKKKEADLSTYKYEKLFKEMLDIFDDVMRADKAGDMPDGIKRIFDKLNKIVANNGLASYTPNKGDDFNENIMSAEALFPAGDELSHKIVDCSLAGYTYNGKIIRYPKVIVGQ